MLKNLCRLFLLRPSLNIKKIRTNAVRQKPIWTPEARDQCPAPLPKWDQNGFWVATVCGSTEPDAIGDGTCCEVNPFLTFCDPDDHGRASKATVTQTVLPDVKTSRLGLATKRVAIN